jgi:amino acid transporter
VERPRSFSRGLWADVRHLLFGSPLATVQEGQQRLSKLKALAVLASDALSSVAYATEEILWVLVAASQAFISLALPVAIAIVGLLLVVVVSYRQTVRAYPQGGGAYSVAKDNLDARVALVAAAALLIDYVLTVAVSISAGTLAIISAFPEIEEYRVQVAIGLLALLVFVHLRGLREAGTIFAIPTYFFILMFFLMIFMGLARVGLGQTEGSVTALRSSGDLLGTVLLQKICLAW